MMFQREELQSELIKLCKGWTSLEIIQSEVIKWYEEAVQVAPLLPRGRQE